MKRLIIPILFFCAVGYSQTKTGDDQYIIMHNDSNIIEPFVLLEGQQLWTNFETVTGESIIETKDISVLNLFVDVNKLDTLPDAGQWCYEGWMYNYDSSIFVCRQQHIRTLHNPVDIPALFSFYRDDPGNLQWIPNEWIEVDCTRVYNEIEYIAIQAHLTLSTWQPDVTPSLWQEKTSGCADFVQPTGGHDAYQIGDCVTYNGNQYESLINNNVWSPATYPAGWQLIN